MAKIIGIVNEPHLVTYKAYDSSEHRCCGTCKYRVMIDCTDEGEGILSASVMDEGTLRDFDTAEAVRILTKPERDEDWCYAQEMPVRLADLNSFINGRIEEGCTPMEAVRDVARTLRSCHAPLFSETRDALRELAALLARFDGDGKQ